MLTWIAYSIFDITITIKEYKLNKRYEYFVSYKLNNDRNGFCRIYLKDRIEDWEDLLKVYGALRKSNNRQAVILNYKELK